MALRNHVILPWSKNSDSVTINLSRTSISNEMWSFIGGDSETALQNKGIVKEIKRTTEDLCENSVEAAASRYKSFSKYISQIEDPEVSYQACKDFIEEEWFPSFLHSDPATLESLVERLLVDSRQEKVREILGRMEKVGLKPSVDIYDFVIQKLYDLNKSDDAEEFCHLVSKRGVKLHVDTYWRVIEDLSSKDQTYEMKRLFYDMIKKGVEPDQYICEQLIQDLCEVQDDYEDAFLVCKECMSMPWFPNFVSTNRNLKDIIQWLLDYLWFDDADELLDTMKEHKSSQLSKIYSTILDKNCERDEGDRAVYFYGKASALDLMLNEDTYCWLVDLFCRDRRLKSLEEVLSDMSKKGVEIDSANYENIVESLCDSDCVDTHDHVPAIQEPFLNFNPIFAGSEAMFADLGHFSQLSIKIAFTSVVYPSLILAYMGQDAYLSKHHVIESDYQIGFYVSVPERLRWPVLAIAILAAVVGSHAIITHP